MPTAKTLTKPIKTNTTNISANFPQKLAGLFEPHRYKIMYGGRGGGKSWSIARALLLIGQQKRTRILCARETQTSIADSVHLLLSEQIHELGLDAFYEIGLTRIVGRNGTEFRFCGIRTNYNQVKSYEGIDICWCEEAATVSRMSWNILIPTIRKAGSEIWVSMNPDLETDNSYERFIKNPPDDALVIPIGWRDNPWFPDVLRQEMEQLKARNYHEYLHTYEGECRQFLEGAVYTEELKLASSEQRICKLPYDEHSPVAAFFDLGYADATSIWLVQMVGLNVHCINYIENRRKNLDFYLKELRLLPYPIDRIYLPHDAKAHTMGSQMSIEELIRQKGHLVQIVPDIGLSDGINAVRTMFARMYFDRDKCADGLNALRHYRYEIVEKQGGGFKNTPVHDKWSHGADSMRYLAVGLKPPKPKNATKYSSYRPANADANSWMSM